MNYTKNHHLPQWEEDDRILRADFNAMCLTLDETLEASAQGGERAWDGLLKLARQNLNDHWPQYDQTKLYMNGGVVYNPLSSSELAMTLSGGAKWKANAGVCAGRGEVLGDTLLRASCIDFWPGNSAAEPGTANDNSVYQFTAPVDGVIKGCSFYLHTYFTASQPALSMMAAFTAEKRSGSGAMEETYRQLFLIERSGTAEKRFEIPLELNIPIEKNGEYRLKIAIVQSTGRTPVPGRFGFVVDRLSETNPTQGYTDHSKITVEAPPVASASLTRTIDAAGAATHGVVMLQYRKNVETSSVSPMLNGRQMSLMHLLKLLDGDGGTYWEAWYKGSGDYLGATELRINFTPDPNDEMCLMRYAAALL